MERLIVTGAAGWLGRNFLRYVGKKYQLRCLLAPWEKKEDLLAIDPTIECIQGDLTHEKDCEKLLDGCAGAYLVHLAGIIHPRRVQQFYQINVNGTVHLLQAAKKHGIRRAVIMSSNSPMGTNPDREHRFDEQSPYRPYMHYGRSKALMEQWVQCFDLETVILRSPWFYGPDQPARQVLFFQMVRDGKVPIIGDGNNYRSMAYVDNIAQGIVNALHSPHAAKKTYWIADEKPYTMNEIIGTIEDVLEEKFGISCRRKRLHLPNWISEVAYGVDKGMQALGLYHQKIHVLSEMNKTIACTVQKAKTELRYQPEIALKEGMFRSIQSAINSGQFEG